MIDYEKEVKERFPNSVCIINFNAYIVVIKGVEALGNHGKSTDDAWRSAYTRLKAQGKL